MIGATGVLWSDRVARAATVVALPEHDGSIPSDCVRVKVCAHDSVCEWLLVAPVALAAPTDGTEAFVASVPA
jgi:hypothetical protein